MTVLASDNVKRISSLVEDNVLGETEELLIAVQLSSIFQLVLFHIISSM